jgi:DNA-binding transcriptional MerR regulator
MMIMDQLVEATGIPERTIREYIRRGIVPDTGGAGEYGEVHVVHLLAIARLREEGVRKHEHFRERMAAMSPEELKEFAYASEDDEEEAADDGTGVTTEQAKGPQVTPRERWTRIVLRPGLELHVRRGVEEEVERLAGEIEGRYGATR